MFRRRSQGFALPTVVVSSVVLFAVLVSAMGAVASIQASLKDQFDQALARDAAESGTVYAEFCYAGSASTATTSQWPKAGTLDTDKGCLGQSRGSVCTTTPEKCYVAENGNTRTTFSVGTATVSGITYQFKSQGQAITARASGGAAAPIVSAPLSFKGNVSVTGIASGNDTSCAIQQAKLYCWGKNNYGQVGNGTTTNVTSPVLIQGPLAGKFVYAVGTGVSHTCAVAGTTPGTTADATAQLYCWGDNSKYQYGIGNNTTSSTIPMLAANTASRYPVAVTGRDHTCTIQVLKTNAADRVEACWGNNQYGQAGESGTATATPTLLNPKPSMGYGFRLRTSPYAQLTSVKEINSVSGNTSCGINGTSAYCIGRNNAGQLGDGSTEGTNPRVKYATGMTNVKSIVSNTGSVCVIRINDGGYNRTWCWGGNGPVSSGDPDYRLDSGPNFNGGSEHGTPKRLLTTGTLLSKNVTDIAMSDYNICQLIDAKVYCSGYNDNGQLGQGNTDGPDGSPSIVRGTPPPINAAKVRSANNAVQVKGELADKAVIRIEGGNNHFCAITSDAGVYCWGGNSLGQLGNGGTSPSEKKPVKVKLPPPVLF